MATGQVERDGRGSHWGKGEERARSLPEKGTSEYRPGSR